ncbi:MAG: T9SS type A sorting domain-containing protein [Flavobacteriales bacterium]|nr:T9SS type A sorting domain-containing protein [Flavobacteriales bacterium]
MDYRSISVLLVAVLHWSLGSSAAAQTLNRRYDPIVPGNAQFAWAIEQNASGQFIAVCNSPWIDSLFYSSKLMTVVIDDNGNEFASYRLDTPLKAGYPGWSNSSIVLPDGRISVVGTTVDPTDTMRTALYWFSSSGEPLSYIEILPSAMEWITYQHKNTPDGGFILTGVTSATGFQDIFLLKTDSLGNVQWWQTYGHPTRLDYATSVDILADGGYCIGGEYPLTLNNVVQWVVRTDSVGNLIWQQPRGLPVETSFNAAVLTTSDGNITYAAGKYSGGNDQQHWPNLVKLDTSGNELWDKTYGTAFFGTGFFALAEVPGSHDLIACGQRYYQTMGGIPHSKGLLLRTNSQGDSLWMREYFYYDSLMADGEGTLRDVQPTPDGGFVAVGAAYGSVSGNNPPGLSQDVWVLKVDSLGCVEPGCDLVTGITAQVTNLKDALRVWPNPVAGGGSVTVGIALPEGLRKGALRLSLISADGRLVMEEPLPASASSSSFPISALPAGLYFLHLSTPDTWLSGTKLVVE